MSGKALTLDTQCRSLGFIDNPKRGYYRTMKTCYSAKPRCRVIAKGDVEFLDSPDIQVTHIGVAAIEHQGTGLVKVTLGAAPIGTGERRYVSACECDRVKTLSGLVPM